MDITDFPPRPAENFRYLRRCRGYGVDDQGRVWSCLKGGNPSTVPALRYLDRWRIVKPHPNPKGYMAIRLIEGRGTGQYHRDYVHRIVLESFVGPCPEGMETRHLNGNPTDNSLSNLAWGTPVENQADKRGHGTANNGSRNPAAKLTESDIPVIRALSASGMTRKQVAAMFEVTPMTIQLIVQGKTWRHV